MKRPNSLELSFNSLDVADRIVVTTNLNQTITTIGGAETIGNVLAFLNRHGHNWTVPRSGVPVARLRLNFYQGDNILGNIGVGKGFLTAHQHGGFYSKALDVGEYPNLLKMIGMDANGDT
jgi:hypothetical protein